jgi:hypothetical protein
VTGLPKYPYILNTGSLKKFLETIPKIGIPQKVNTTTLPTLGFKSNNDRPIAGIFRFIDFIDGNGAPTQRYRDFRITTKSKIVMADALKKAYSELFDLYPDAWEKDDLTLRNFFAPTTNAGEQVLNQIVATFKSLCYFADFKGVAEERKDEGEQRGKVTEEGQGAPRISPGVTVNLNIQLTLPATDDASVYDKIFKALKDHLLTRD